MPSSAPDPGSSENNVARPKNSADSTSPSHLHTNTMADLEPEGGIVAWCTVFGVFLSQFCVFGYLSSFGVYQAFYTRHYLQNESPSAISLIGSLTIFLVAALGPISGRLFDNGYFYHVYITGAFLISLSMFMLSLVQPGKYYQVMLTQGLTCGVGMGLICVPSLAILSHHFKCRRTTMLSIVISGVALGGISHTIMLNKLLNGPLGFKTGVRISASFVTALLFLSCTLVRTRYRVVCQKSTSVETWKATKKCFTEVPALLAIIGFTCYHVVYLYPYYYFQIDSLRHGLDAEFSFYAVVIIDAGSFVGRLAVGALLPLAGVIDISIIATIVCAVLIISMIWLRSVASVVILGVLYGFFSGINIGVMVPMLSLTSEPAELGERMGVGFAIIAIGNLVGAPISGALLTRNYRWWAPALFCGVVALVGAVSLIGVRFSFVRWQARAEATRNRTSGEGKEETGDENGKDLASISP